MLKRWQKLKVRERLIYLVLFAVLLPTVILSVTQYYSLRDLREKTRGAFENSLRQTIYQIEDNIDRKLKEIGNSALDSFDITNLGQEKFDRRESQLKEIVQKNSHLQNSFVFISEADGAGFTAIFDESNGFIETQAKPSTDNALFNTPEEESLTVSFVAVLQKQYEKHETPFFVQSRCEKCAPIKPPTNERFYLYRPLSDIRNIQTLRFIGVGLKRDFVVNELFPSVINDLKEAQEKNKSEEIIFGIFDEEGKTLFTNSEKNLAQKDFEVQIPLRQTFNRWTLAATYRDNLIEELSASYFRRNLLLLGLIVSLLFGGLILILGVTAQEVELAAAKSAFVSNVSHELKTPLALIRLFAETLESGRVKSPEKAQEYYRIITNETGRLTQLINNILDFAAIEAGRKEYNFKAQDLCSVVKETIGNYRYVLENTGFEIKTFYTENLPPILIDRDAVSQVVLNLLNNALKYSGEKRFVEIRVEKREQEALIAVTDHGIGIAAHETDKIFEKFYRAGGNADVHDVKGSGLGLSLVKHIVEAHGGRITVSSVLERGSTFTIFLPLEKIEKSEIEI